MKKTRPILYGVLILCMVSVVAVAVEPCRVKVVDDENGWPVPLVFLTTTHGQVYVTDNAGVAAIDSPELMGRETWFSVKSHVSRVSTPSRQTASAGRTSRSRTR